MKEIWQRGEKHEKRNAFVTFNNNDIIIKWL
jgi:hypothetical protein